MRERLSSPFSLYRHFLCLSTPRAPPTSLDLTDVSRSTALVRVVPRTLNCYSHICNNFSLYATWSSNNAKICFCCPTSKMVLGCCRLELGRGFSPPLKNLVIDTWSCSCPSFSYSMSIHEMAMQWSACPCCPMNLSHWQFLTMCSGMPCSRINAWRRRLQKFILEMTSILASLKVCCRNWRLEANWFHSLHTKRSWKNFRSGSFAYTLSRPMYCCKRPHSSGSMVLDSRATHLQGDKLSSMSYLSYDRPQNKMLVGCTLILE